MSTELIPYAQVVETARQQLSSSLVKIESNTSDAKAKELVTGLIKSLNPDKRGCEEDDAGWSLPTMRVIQGVSKDRPHGSQNGDIVVSNGTILTSPVRIVPIYMYQINRMFPMGAKVPTCSAPDAKLGSMFGYCNRCPNQPMTQNSTGQKTQCDNGVCIIALTSELQAVRIEFFKTSRRAGDQIRKWAKLSVSDIWDRYYLLKSQVQMGDQTEWYIFRAEQGESSPQHVRDTAAALYEMVKSEREAVLKAYYARISAGQKKSDQLVEDSSGIDVAPPSNVNPDLSSAGL